uniref:Uncharacterized protein n=1 Tax=Anguilla anguilla TaxID=7936 RepID=A0A0E9PEJ9_ANGAN
MNSAGSFVGGFLVTGPSPTGAGS